MTRDTFEARWHKLCAAIIKEDRPDDYSRARKTREISVLIGLQLCDLEAAITKAGIANAVGHGLIVKAMGEIAEAVKGKTLYTQDLYRGEPIANAKDTGPGSAL
ncbi:hypothetical protein LCGC14_0568770 [marine sediment metagenome]|uniref:Uncharacterized protein n=1 Tax=marine sediment metagenome TaxID=412755 RepID=A0A0F9U6A0_9ZZZZ|nr:hypothetical protein [Phycisphaerae bacterium]